MMACSPLISTLAHSKLQPSSYKSQSFSEPKNPCSSMQFSPLSSIPSYHVMPNSAIGIQFPFKKSRGSNKVNVASSPTPMPSGPNKMSSSYDEKEDVFFDGGAHYGDLLANLIFGFSLLWMPLTVAAVFRALFLRYRFTNARVTVISGLTGGDRRDFSYKVVTDVQTVPRFIGAWGDVIITLADGTKVDLRSVPKFREIADYCLLKAGKDETSPVEATGPKGF